LSQQVSHSSLLTPTKRTYDSRGDEFLPETSSSKSTPAKKEKSQRTETTDEDMAAKLAEIESKYESLKNNSLKLAAAVIKGENAPDKAKDILDAINK